jgi:hypothetical protein
MWQGHAAGLSGGWKVGPARWLGQLGSGGGGQLDVEAQGLELGDEPVMATVGVVAAGEVVASELAVDLAGGAMMW